MKAIEHQPLWASEQGHRVDINTVAPSDYIIVFQRLREGSATLQYKWNIDENNNLVTSADYFVPKKENALKQLETIRLEQLRAEFERTQV